MKLFLLLAHPAGTFQRATFQQSRRMHISRFAILFIPLSALSAVASYCWAVVKIWINVVVHFVLRRGKKRRSLRPFSIKSVVDLVKILLDPKCVPLPSEPEDNYTAC